MATGESNATPAPVPLPRDLREKLDRLIVAELLGPQGGPTEEVTETRVSDRYLVGMLAPRSQTAGQEADEGFEDGSEPDESDDGKADPVRKRTQSGTEQLSVGELRGAFMSSQSLEEAALAGNQRRQTEWESKLGYGLVALIDVYPVPWTAERFDPSVHEFREACNAFLGRLVLAKTERIAFDGYVFSNDTLDEVRVKRNGCISIRRLDDADNKTLASVAFPEWLIKCLERSLAFYEKLNVKTPVLACLSLARAKGWTLTDSRMPYSSPDSIDQSPLEFPVLSFDRPLVDDHALMIGMRSWLDRVWNACGLDGCPLYRDDGTADWRHFVNARSR